MPLLGQGGEWDPEPHVPEFCGVCGDHGVYGLCSDCARLGGAVLWTREDLDYWLQDKGIRPEYHVTYGRFGEHANFYACGIAYQERP